MIPAKQKESNVTALLSPVDHHQPGGVIASIIAQAGKP